MMQSSEAREEEKNSEEKDSKEKEPEQDTEKEQVQEQDNRVWTTRRKLAAMLAILMLVSLLSSCRLVFGNPGPQARPVHDVPGPPYNGPPPRNPRLPLDEPIIHPSNNNFHFRRPPRTFDHQEISNLKYQNTPIFKTTPYPTTTTVAKTTTTTTETTTAKIRPQGTIMQQPHGNGYRPYEPYGYDQYSQYPPSYYPPQYQAPYPPPTPSPTPAPTTTTTTTTTTRKPRKRRKKKKTTMSPNRVDYLSQGQLTIMDNQLVPMDRVPDMLAQPSNNRFSNRVGMANSPSGRRFQPKNIARGRRRFLSGPRPGQGMRGNANNFRRYVEYPRVPAREPGNRRFDMPNIYSQSGFDFENDNRGNIEKPIIQRPRPQHAGVKLPGIQVPPNAGNIQDIISPKPLPNPSSYPAPNTVDRYTTNDGKYTIVNNFRPPIGSKPNQYQPSGSYVPPNQPPINYNKPAYQEPKPQYDNNYAASYNPYSKPPYEPLPPSQYESYRPAPDQNYDQPPSYNQQPNSNYDQPSYRNNNNPPAKNYNPSQEAYKPSPPPYNPPSYNYRPINAATPTSYTPPPAPYNPPQAPYTPPPAPSKPPPPSYQRPYNPPVQPPVYNQDFVMTDDPQVMIIEMIIKHKRLPSRQATLDQKYTTAVISTGRRPMTWTACR